MGHKQTAVILYFDSTYDDLEEESSDVCDVWEGHLLGRDDPRGHIRLPNPSRLPQKHREGA